MVHNFGEKKPATVYPAKTADLKGSENETSKRFLVSATLWSSKLKICLNLLKDNLKIWTEHFITSHFTNDLMEIKFIYSKKAKKIEKNLHRLFDIM